jgi:predicted nucleotidyltransferase
MTNTEQLEARARDLARTLAVDPSTVAVLLIGSVARGDAKQGSDLDLLLVRDGDAGVPETWRFAANEVMENVHELHLDALPSDLSDSALVDWYAHHVVADHLQGCRVLYVDSHRADRLTQLWTVVRRRVEPGMQAGVARVYAAHAASLAHAATVALPHAPLDAHQTLRVASQRLLEASLIRLGWTIRGSKRRPEIAERFRADATAAHALDLLGRVVGLCDVTPDAARQLASSRIRIRKLLVEELRRLSRDNPRAVPVAESVARHNSAATDYHGALIAAGFHRGAINHIRALAGFHTIPAMVLNAIGASAQTVDAFMQHEGIDRAVRRMWMEIAQLDGRSLDSWSPRLISIADAIRESTSV